MHRGTEVRRRSKGRSIMRERAQARQPRRCLPAVAGLGWVGTNLPPNRIAGGRAGGDLRWSSGDLQFNSALRGGAS